MATIPLQQHSQYNMQSQPLIFHYPDRSIQHHHNDHMHHDNPYPYQTSQPLIMDHMPLPFQLPPPHCMHQSQPHHTHPIPPQMQQRQHTVLPPPIPLAPPFKKRKLSNASYNITTRNKEIEMQQKLDQTVTQNKDLSHKIKKSQQELSHYVSDNKYLQNKNKELQRKNKSLLNRQKPIQQPLAKTKKTLLETKKRFSEDINAMKQAINQQSKIINGRN
eukprot:UN05689